MTNLSEQEISHLQAYPEPLRAVYKRVRSHARENGLQPHVTKGYISFTKHGRNALIRMYFFQSSIHFYVCHDNYRYYNSAKERVRGFEQNRARIEDIVKSYKIKEPNRGRSHKHFYLMVDSTEHMDELQALMQPVLSHAT